MMALFSLAELFLLLRGRTCTDSRASVKCYGARGDGSDDSAAIQRAIDTGREVYFPAGRYGFTQIRFSSERQNVVFESGATLVPLGVESRVVFADAHDSVVRGLSVDAGPVAVERMLEVTRCPGIRFDDVRLVGSAALEFVYLENMTKVVFTGGEIFGTSASPKAEGSLGLHAGEGVHELRAFGLSIHHVHSPVRFTGPTHDDPAFFGCNFENGAEYGIEYDPVLTGPYNGTIRNLTLHACHIEGTPVCVGVTGGGRGQVLGASLTGCRLAPATKSWAVPGVEEAVIRVEGWATGVVMSGCHHQHPAEASPVTIWSADSGARIKDSVDLYNVWLGPHTIHSPAVDGLDVVRAGAHA